MGGLLEKPDRKKTGGKNCGNGVSCGVSSMQGWRERMEDTLVAKISVNDDLKEFSYFAVFDGHAGGFAASFCEKTLMDVIVNHRDFKDNPSVVIEQGFVRLDNDLRLASTDRSGSTAVLSFINDSMIVVANCGDSRLVLCRNSQPFFATRDHTPLDPSEQARIKDAGGTVTMGRVNGNLAVSRAIGDFSYKSDGKNIVSNIPDIFVLPRHPDDQFMVLACDGIWNVMSNEEICFYIYDRLLVMDDLEAIANDVVETCLYKGSRDNMSIIIVKFQNALTPQHEAIMADQKLDSVIYERMKNIILRYPNNNYYTLLQELKFIHPFEGLPRGGDFESKRLLMDKIYQELKTKPEDLETKILLDKIVL
ncbi:unnamed protein product [Brassicogethes aeneus]|uniref:PPM-type phosphatase domain-containing protein n=1 Tax=Brassicogethes aeneus TaxID=1431903 RepID=A0A9P0BIE7_BRAAE|nr:unnamed protein product [Brassicogethes aeneus]